jgi:uncharacterized protein (TIGR02001 family)
MLAQPSQGQGALAPAAAARPTAKCRRCRLDRGAQAVALLLLNLIPGAADAQIAATASLLSDYRYRGITYSGQKPAAQLSVAYDDPADWYVGAFGSTVRFGDSLGAGLEGKIFGGYAHQFSPGMSFEAGAVYSLYNDISRWNYGEGYLGLSLDNVGLRLHYARKYLGQRTDGIYGEISYTRPVAERVQFFAHGGYMYMTADSFYATGADRRVFDVRVGVGADFEWFHADLAWVGISRADAGSRLIGSSSPNTVVLTLSRAF